MGVVAAVNVTDTATLVIPQNTKRTSFYLLNNGVAQIYVGENSAITTADGFPLAAASQVSEDEGSNIYKGDIYAICAAVDSPVELRYWERNQGV